VFVLEKKMILNKMDSKEPTSIIQWINMQWKAILAEFMSTMILIIIGCMSCIPIEGFTPSPSMYVPLTFGFTIMFNIQIFGHISGAFMNPIVSIIAAIWGKISISVAIAFIIAEVAGATLGYGILMVVAPIDAAAEGICVTAPNSALNDIQALGVEILLTVVLSLLNCAVWDPVNEHKMDSVPLKFGLAIAGLSFAGGPLTGASMNPARTFGPSLWTNSWKSHWVYWAGPIIGGVLPAVLYKYTWLQKPRAVLELSDIKQ
jgi:aquaporin rerated protein, invertebrate